MRKNQAAAQGSVELTDKNFVASLQKGLEVLTCFGRQHGQIGRAHV